MRRSDTRIGHRILGVVLGVGLLLTGALIAMPATWVLPSASQAVPMRAVATTGSIWRGQTYVAVGQAGYERTLPDPFRWSTHFTPLPVITISHPWLDGPVTVRPHMTGVVVSGQSIELPAELLSTIHAALASTRPGGDIRITWPAQHFGAGERPAGTLLGQIEWRNAQVALTPVAPLGSYRADISTQADRSLAILLATTQGPLFAQGSGWISGVKPAQFNLMMEVDPTAPVSVRQALQSFMAAIGASGSTGSGQTRLRLQ